MTLKNFLVGAVGTVAILGAPQAFAWDTNAVQRGWVDAIGTVPYSGAVFGPSIPMSIQGWACVRPDLSDAGVPPTQIAVSYYSPSTGQVIALPLLAIRQVEYRPDLAAYSACAGSYRGFTVWVTKPVTTPTTYYVAFQGPHGTTFLEGQSSY